MTGPPNEPSKTQIRVNTNRGPISTSDISVSEYEETFFPGVFSTICKINKSIRTCQYK